MAGAIHRVGDDHDDDVDDDLKVACVNEIEGTFG